MTRDDIIRMAREAGFYVDGQFHLTFGIAVEHFAALVASAEREACAKVAEDHDRGTAGKSKVHGQRIAHKIRARDAS
jgi:hypothetical protein